MLAVFWDLENLYPSGRDIQGCWTWDELKSAVEAGCKIRKILGVWRQIQAEQVFLPWLEAVWKGREMGGFAGQLAKATGNATWGQFSIAKGQRKIMSATEERLVPMRGGNPSQRAFDLAEAICGRVRARLYIGMLDAGPLLISAHTDGLWSGGDPVPYWRHDADADELRIFNAQVYSHRAKGGEWFYTVAGQIDAPAFFEAKWAEVLAAGLPTVAEAETNRLARARREGVAEILSAKDLTTARD